MKTGAWFIHCFDVPIDIDIQDSLMVIHTHIHTHTYSYLTAYFVWLQHNVMIKKITLSQGMYSDMLEKDDLISLLISLLCGLCACVCMVWVRVVM